MIPLELLTLIVNFLAEDEDLTAIRCCCLTSRQFVHTCRTHLFSTIKATQHEHHSLPYHGGHAYDEPQDIYHPIDRYENIYSSRPSLASYVRNLEISSICNYTPVTGFSVLRHLNQVKNFTFAFSNGNIHTGKSKPWPKIANGIEPQLLAFIQQNTIVRLSLFNIDHIPLTILQHLKSLEELTIRNLTVKTDVNAKLPPIQLRTFNIESRFASQFVEEAILSSKVFSLSGTQKISMFLTSEYDNSIAIIGRVLPLPQGLAHLKLVLDADYSEWTCEDNVTSKLSPGTLKTLRTLEVECVDSGSAVFPPYGHFQRELQRISGSNVLEELKISISVAYIVPDMNAAAWNELDVILSTGFPSLRKLDIKVSVGIYFSETPFQEAAVIQARLEKIFSETFHWSRKNLLFSGVAEGWVI